MHSVTRVVQDRVNAMDVDKDMNRIVVAGRQVFKIISIDDDQFTEVVNLRVGKQKNINLSYSAADVAWNHNDDSVRDVQFCPPSHGYFSFAAAYDSGTVQMWDMRRPDKSERQFTAHNEPVFSLDWHPEDKNWLATAGRDKMIKVWEINKQPAQLAYSVQTIASVGRIKWRPQRRFHIASCSLLLDHSINVWDIRRPYIPFASFDEHKDVATCLIWKDEPHTFLSTGKDSMLIQHIFNDAKRPADSVIPAGIDISIHGDFCCAFREKNNTMKTTLVVSSPDVEIEARADIDKDKKMQNGEISTGSDDDSEGESSEYEKNLANIASGLGHNGDFFFGDGDADIVPYSLGMSIRGNEGDVQTSVSMLIVLGDHVRSHIEEETQENWFLSYIDLLSRFQLWTIACEVIALSHLPQVCQMNQASTTIYTACSQCSRRLENNSWVCDRCKIVTNICCIW
nr:hypothetical protein BaRGS_016706 [Batillaria attramentaria]